MFCHHQPWSIKQWDPTFKRPSVNYTQMFLLIVFLIEIFLTWNSGCNFSIKTFSQKEQKYWKLVFVHCWTWSDGDCRSGRIVSCPKCKCWLVPRSDQLDHLTSPHREGSVSVGQTVLQARGIIHSRSRHTASCRKGRTEMFCNSLIKFDILLLLLHKPLPWRQWCIVLIWTIN